jgi:hypothetical protein
MKIPTHPSEGDVVIGCCHKPDPHNAHFYWIEIEFTRRTRSGAYTAVANWLLLCDDCFVKHGADIAGAVERSEVEIGCDMIWPKALSVVFVTH